MPDHELYRFFIMLRYDTAVFKHFVIAINHEEKTWGGQITDFVYIQETDTVMAMCDTWWQPTTTHLDESTYLWLPINGIFNTGSLPCSP
jgi:hypothetical protein